MSSCRTVVKDQSIKDCIENHLLRHSVTCYMFMILTGIVCILPAPPYNTLRVDSHSESYMLFSLIRIYHYAL